MGAAVTGIEIQDFLNAAVAIDAMRTGKHVLVEKPITQDGAQAAVLVQLAAVASSSATGTTLFTSPHASACSASSRPPPRTR